MTGRMRDNAVIAATLVVGAMSPGEGRAQTSSPATPPVAAPSPHIVEDPYIGVFGFEDRDDEGLVRRAEPLGRQTDWIPETDPMVARVKTGGGEAGGNAFLNLTVGVDGRVTACQLQIGYGNPSPPDGLCERVPPRARFRPALDLDGQPAADVYTVQVGYGRRARLATTPAPERVVRHAAPPPAPPMPNEWPPTSRVSAVTVQGLPLLEGGGDALEAHDTPFVGVEIRLDERGRVTACTRIAGDLDAQLQQEACALARRARYDLSAETSQYRRHMRFHFVRQKGGLRALSHSRNSRTLPILTPEAAQALTTGTTEPWPVMWVRVDRSGKAERCRILETSGDDARDARSCRAILQFARFTPARDTLDRSTVSTLYRWRPTDTQP